MTCFFLCVFVYCKIAVALFQSRPQKRLSRGVFPKNWVRTNIWNTRDVCFIKLAFLISWFDYPSAVDVHGEKWFIHYSIKVILVTEQK